jgi:hypothetical protein
VKHEELGKEGSLKSAGTAPKAKAPLKPPANTPAITQFFKKKES